ncbi:MAG: hypothetical protein JO086_12465 [Acidimicrobiia bacterium]|nr:hypothetical protein [Acidimicrobiia bacterium]
MAQVMAAAAWDELQNRAVDAVREGGGDSDDAARRLLALCGGNRRVVMATRVRLATIAASTPDALNPRRALALVDRAIAMADGEALWHPIFSDLDTWRVARHHAAP